MKKRALVLLVFAAVVVFLAGCGNKDLIDTNFRYDKAIIELGNGDVVEGEVTNWRDYDGDQIQVKIDGKTYLVHSSKITLIKE